MHQLRIIVLSIFVFISNLLTGQVVDGGNIALPNGDLSAIACVTSGQEKVFDIILNNNSGENSAWVVTDTFDMIIGLPANPPIDLDNYIEEQIRVWHLSYEQIDGLAVGVTKDDITGNFDYSNHVFLGQKRLFPGTLSLVSGDTIISCSGDGLSDSITLSIINNNGLNNAFIISDIDGKILNIDQDSIINTDSLGIGLCYIQHITFESGLIGLVKDSSLINLIGCYELSNQISISKTVVNGGYIYLGQGRTDITICVGDGQADAFTPTLINDIGTNKRWIITDSLGKILALVNNGTFNLEGVGPGKCRIYHVRYESIQNLVRNQNIDSLSGCFDLSNPIRINRIEGDTKPGILSSNTINDFCNGDGIGDTVVVNNNGNIGDRYTQIIVDQNGIILDTFSGKTYDFEGFKKVNIAFVLGLSYIDGLQRLEIGANVEDLEGCYSISNSIPVSIENTSGGIITFSNDADSIIICSGDQLSDIANVNIVDTCGLVYQWVITNPSGTILSIQSISSVDLDIDARDSTYLSLIAYNSTITGIDLGKNIASITGCFGLSNQLLILNSFGVVEGGDLSTEENKTRCIQPDIIDTIRFSISNFEGDSTFFVLVSSDTIIEITKDTFMVLSNFMNGVYTLYHIASKDYISGVIIGNNINDILGCYERSNGIEINIQFVNGGQISANPTIGSSICLGDSLVDNISINISDAIGEDSYIILTDTFGTIIDVYINNEIIVDSQFPDVFLLRNMSFNGSISGLVKDSSINNINGCVHFSPHLQFSINRISPIQISFPNDQDTLIYCAGFQDPIVDVIFAGGQGEDTLIVISDIDGRVISSQDSTRINLSLIAELHLSIKVYTASDSILIDTAGIVSTVKCWVRSNTLEIINRRPSAGQISFDNLADTLYYCDNQEILDSIQTQASGVIGDKQTLVITDLNNNIINTIEGYKIDPASLNVDTAYIYNLSYYDAVPINIDTSISSLEGCLDLGDPMVLIFQRINGGSVTFEDGDSTKISCIGDNLDSLLLLDTLGHIFSYIIADQDSSIIIFGPRISDLGIDTLSAGKYCIWHLSSTEGVPLSIGNNISNLTGCVDLSNKLNLEIQQSINDLDIITLDSIIVNCDNDFVRNIYITPSDTSGLSKYYVVIDTAGNIISIEDTSMFIIGDGQYEIIQLGFNTIPENFQTSTNLLNLRGCFGFSNTLLIESQIFDGGQVSISGLDQIDFCGIGVTSDSLYPTLSSRGSPNSIWIVTDDEGLVLDTFNTLPVIIDNNGPDICYIQHIAYLDGISLPEIDSALTNIDGCYDISNQIQVSKTLIRGGSILVNNDTILNICSGDQTIDQVNISITGSTGPNSAWLLSDTLSNIVSILATPPNNFNGLPTGSCLLRHIRYLADGLSGLDVGFNIDELSGCYQTSNALRINKISVNGGKLSVIDTLRELTICVDDGVAENITPILIENIGPNQLWMITSAIGEITSLDIFPPFNFEGEEEGQSFIWNVNYADDASGLELGLFLSDIEGCLAISNPIRIRKKIGNDCVVSTNDDLNLTDISISPNPTNGILNISNQKVQKGTISIFNTYGTIVSSQPLEARQFYDISLDTYVSGIYYIKIETSLGKYSFRIIKI